MHVCVCSFHIRSGGQHNHHSQQRLSYGQNRPNFHNGSHNMHSNHGGNHIANVQTNVPSSQQQTGINKHKQQESNLNIQQTNQSRYKQMDAQSLNTSNKENVLNMVNDNNASKLIIEMGHGCTDDQNGSNATNSTASSHTTKTAMCLINEIVRANQVKHLFFIDDNVTNMTK